MKRDVAAVAVWFAKVSAIATPTAADAPAVSPEALVVAVAVVVAANVTAPAASCVGPGFACPDVVTLLTVSAIAGASATEPAAPVFASVVVVFVAIAASSSA